MHKLDKSIELGWLDQSDAEQRVRTARSQDRIDDGQADRCFDYLRTGYCIVRGLVPERLTAAAATAPAMALEGKLHLPRVELLTLLQDCWRTHAGVRDLLVYEPVLAWIGLLLGERSTPLQSLSLPESSQQGAHSDEIFMSTRMRGAMAAAWVALEDVQPYAGPLQLWPSSHRWSYLSMADIGGRDGMSLADRRRLFDENYYARMGAKVADSGVEAVPIILRRGDVLFWHQGLVHGARHVERAGSTRNSLIVHYVATSAEVYSDAWGHDYPIPAVLTTGPLSEDLDPIDEASNT
jgi:hypothetical protein